MVTVMLALFTGTPGLAKIISMTPGVVVSLIIWIGAFYSAG